MLSWRQNINFTLTIFICNCQSASIIRNCINKRIYVCVDLQLHRFYATYQALDILRLYNVIIAVEAVVGFECVGENFFLACFIMLAYVTNSYVMVLFSAFIFSPLVCLVIFLFHSVLFILFFSACSVRPYTHITHTSYLFSHINICQCIGSSSFVWLNSVFCVVYSHIHLSPFLPIWIFW